MRHIVGPLAAGDFPQGRWAYNILACDDSYDAASHRPDLLILEAHGRMVDGQWVMSLEDGEVGVGEYIRTQAESEVFAYVCNPGGIRIWGRPGQTVTFARGVIRGPYDMAVVTERGERKENGTSNWRQQRFLAAW
mgnify:FL=1